jgi:hypothetical protein
MYSPSQGYPFTVQQSVSGTGAFTGVDYGRARGQISHADPNAVVLVSAKHYGTTPNSYTVAFIDAGAGVTVPGTTVQQIGPAIRVTLRRSANAGVLATAAEVANAINAANTGIAAHYGGTGNGVVSAVPPTPITSEALGADPVVVGPNRDMFNYYVPVNQNAGLFYFENEVPLVLREFQAKFIIGGGTHSVQVLKVPLNPRLQPINSEAIPIFNWSLLSSTQPDIAFADGSIVVHPRQAIQVITSSQLPGIVRLTVQRSAIFPYN